MSTLDGLLDGLDVSVAAYAVCELRGEAGILLDAPKRSCVHYVLAGSGAAWREDGTRLALPAHSVLVVPAGIRLALGTGRVRPRQYPPPDCASLPGDWDRMRVGAGPIQLVLACGTVHATARGAAGLFDHLHQPLVEQFAGDAALQHAFSAFLAEMAAPRDGTKAMAEVLMKQCLILLLRRQFERSGNNIPWLVALESGRIGRAVSVMFERPEAPLTLAQLADIAGMSRAAFAVRIKQTVGRSAMDYLREIRLCKAAKILATSDLPIKPVAHRVGFTSRSYFSRTFTAFTGVGPAAYRAMPHAARGSIVLGRAPPPVE